MIFLDSNAVIDLLGQAPDRTDDWAAKILERSVEVEPLVCDLVVLAEVAAGFDKAELALLELAAIEVEIRDGNVDAALRASQAFREYRRRGGPRSTMLPDFLIAAHAATLGASLMTRDRRLASYFPELSFITPETEHG